MTMQTSSALLVQKPIAQCTMRARRSRTSISAATEAFAVSPAVGWMDSRTRKRSTTRPSRLTSTERIAPTPVSKNTGATASWMTWAMLVIPGSACIMVP